MIDGITVSSTDDQTAPCRDFSSHCLAVVWAYQSRSEASPRTSNNALQHPSSAWPDEIRHAPQPGGPIHANAIPKARIMNHEPPAPTSEIPSSYHHPDHASASHSSQAETAATASHQEPQQRVRSSQKMYKTRCLDHLIRNLDIMIYAELSILYYMEYACPVLVPRFRSALYSQDKRAHLLF